MKKSLISQLSNVIYCLILTRLTEFTFAEDDMNWERLFTFGDYIKC